MKHIGIFLLWIAVASCQAQVNNEIKVSEDSIIISSVELYYWENVQDSIPSQSIGSVSNGRLLHGTLLPFEGKNYHYFDTTSYSAGRCFMHQSVAQTVLSAYQSLDSLLPERTFGIMECAHKEGGKLEPHRTHQNGLSIDFMSPLLKNDSAYYELDYLGGPHYLLDFNDDGTYKNDPAISIDFDAIALHILTLQAAAKKNGVSIEKVIFKTELKDELYASAHGEALKKSGIYITKNLTPLINSLHDDHYHIDFQLLP